jgi:hypothetical protein
MNMYWFMLIGIEEYKNPHIFKNFWHKLFFTNLINTIWKATANLEQINCYAKKLP